MVQQRRTDRKEPPVIPHMPERPVEGSRARLQIAGVQVSECDQRDDRLGDGVDIDRVGLVVIVGSDMVTPQEVSAIELKTLEEVGVELRGVQLTCDVPECAEVEARVEIVDPALCPRLSIEPCPSRADGLPNIALRAVRAQ